MPRISNVAVLFAVVALGVAGSARPAPAAQTLPTTAALRICTGCSQYGLSDGSRYRYVILHAWQSALIPQLKSTNPAIKVLVYKDLAASVAYACHNGVDDALLPAGVGYCWADKNQPGWFLKDTTGARIEFCDYPGVWQMDVGSGAYQQQWLTNVAAEAKRLGFDGVVLDDANQSEAGHLCGRTIAKYPTQTDYTAATGSFLSTVAKGLQAQGLLALPNIMIADYWTANGRAVWDAWVSYSSGAVQEYFTKWSRESTAWFTDDGQSHNDWSARQAFLARTEAAGKIYLGITYAPSGDDRSMRYARASFLSDWSGGPSALAYEPTTPEAQDPYAAGWTMEIGTPLGPRYKVGVAWRRDYTGGAVIVNPSPSTQQSVSLGASYLAADGSTVSSVTVPATDALILRATTSTTPPPPAPSPVTAPTNTSLPTLSTIRGGSGLSALPGTWTGSPTSYAYQWLRCASDGNTCAPITGATGQSYLLAKEEVGSRMRITVTASNPTGSGTATSAPTSTVTVSSGGKPRALTSLSGNLVVSVRASGVIRSRHAVQRFSIRWMHGKIRVRYVDRRLRMSFRSELISRLEIDRNRLVVAGRGVTHGRRLWFTVSALDRGDRPGADSIRIRLSNGYGRSGRLVAGAVRIP